MKLFCAIMELLEVVVLEWICFETKIIDTFMGFYNNVNKYNRIIKSILKNTAKEYRSLPTKRLPIRSKLYEYYLFPEIDEEYMYFTIYMLYKGTEHIYKQYTFRVSLTQPLFYDRFMEICDTQSNNTSDLGDSLLEQVVTPSSTVNSSRTIFYWVTYLLNRNNDHRYGKFLGIDFYVSIQDDEVELTTHNVKCKIESI